MTHPLNERERIACIISGAPFPSKRSYAKADAILSTPSGEVERLKGELEEARAEIAQRDAVAKAAWGDQRDEHSDAIDAAHPCETKDFASFDTALTMVGKRRGKYELVGLVNWLLVRAQSSEAQVSDLLALVGRMCGALEEAGDEICCYPDHDVDVMLRLTAVEREGREAVSQSQPSGVDPSDLTGHEGGGQ